jgi:uncharacterized protein GlcG (DUF336 family)
VKSRKTVTALTGIALGVAIVGALIVVDTTGCGGGSESCGLDTNSVGVLSAEDVQRAVSQAASFAADQGTPVTIAVSDRQGNPLAIFRMNGSSGANGLAYVNARTPAFFSTNGNAFTTRTAGFILQDQYPPGIPNTTAGPLFGVQFSSLSCSDIQRTGRQFVTIGTGLSDFPGSVPLYQGNFAAGGLGVTGSGDPLTDEQIALAGGRGFEAPEGARADHIFLDGFRLPFTDASPPANVTVHDVAGSFVLGPVPTQSTGFGRRQLANGINVEQPFPTVGGSQLSAAEVDQILAQGAQRGEGTRAAIRECGPMKMNVAVVDVNGRVLGVVRTLDAPIFGLDVAVQKARTALAFSDPNQSLGEQIRSVLGFPQGSPLAVSTRAVGFLSQIHYPPAVEGNPPGPFGRDPNDPNSTTLQQRLSPSCAPFGNGITIFPGGLPLYKGGALVGAIGISGDGVNQDEIVAESGSVGFEAPAEIRTDRVEFRGTTLPYLKEPRNPGSF